MAEKTPRRVTLLTRTEVAKGLGVLGCVVGAFSWPAFLMIGVENTTAVLPLLFYNSNFLATIGFVGMGAGGAGGYLFGTRVHRRFALWWIRRKVTCGECGKAVTHLATFGSYMLASPPILALAAECRPCKSRQLWRLEGGQLVETTLGELDEHVKEGEARAMKNS